jgi:diguanylate cyclase (GGDEF)-like protein/PAS domain S-box-containing protein
VYFVDRERRITYWNGGAERLSGYAPKAVAGRSCADNVLVHVDAEGRCLCTAGCPLADTLKDGMEREAQIFMRHASGHRVPILVRVAPIRNSGGEITGAVEIFSDNSSMIAAERRLAELGEAVVRDELTGAGNRRYVESRIAAALAERKYRSLSLGALMFDIDHFKTINDTYGHDTGDEVLNMVARTVEKNIRATDSFGRWGGDEFVVVLLGVDAAGLVAVANKLRNIVAASGLAVAGHLVQVNISIGATLARPDDTVDTLLKRVDDRLYDSKSAGRDRVSFVA